MAAFDPVSAAHIFRRASGHLSDTPVNRRLLIDTVDERFLLGSDQFGSEWYARVVGTQQVWVLVRNGYIRNGGVNERHRVFNPLTGLSAEEPSHGRTDE
ncbi:hypothetical protein [Aurantimonas sp. VKM B-3413]|uniref:hypothetical protein n=1 Tax=Aurantimonas sp. VKM B-3413 TaxID=2779401 RepID=UPI001E2A855A|nr:hypothetical protein [Aurantimonas sp. VKM B-3413]MCB8836873.1 hypothetical protein [Aurantimonas sp. VKM B-3413]